MKYRKMLAALITGAMAGLIIGSAYAHAFGERYDLPIPLNYFLIGGAATVALSFVVIGIFVKGRSERFSYPRFNFLDVPVLGTVLSSRVFLFVVRLLSVGVFALIVGASLFGENRPLDNISPTFVWIIWWVGMGYIAALLGNFWMLVNPWKITYEWVEWILRRSPSNRGQGMFSYPAKWDVWPALALFLVFAWMENIYTGAVEPFQLGSIIMIYSVITWGGMLAFGKHEWLRRGEAFSVLFGFFARFSPTEVRIADASVCEGCGYGCRVEGGDCVDCYECFEKAPKQQRQFNLRPYAVGLANLQRVTTATGVFVVLALAAVTFDGLQETPTWIDVQAALLKVVPDLDTVDTLGLLLVPVLFLAVYLGFSWGIKRLSGDSETVQTVAKAFVFSLVPIALAYNLAHFISLLAIQGQSIIPLLSDPFGFGWDILGTSDYRINISVINARFVWFISVAAIVLGHVVSVYIAHVISLRRVSSHSMALRGQYPMLTLMVLYTATSLWIIAQPIVEN